MVIQPVLPPDDNLSVVPDARAIVEAITQQARLNLFRDFRIRKSKHTIRRYDTDLDVFYIFLVQARLRSEKTENDLGINPAAWSDINWGLVNKFVEWMLIQEYAVTTVISRLATIKVFARLAAQAGFLPQAELFHISNIRNYAKREIARIDAERLAQGRNIRRQTKIGETTSSGELVRNTKKSTPSRLTDTQAKQLKHMDDQTPTGRRNNLLMSLLLDHGLRVGEVALLRIERVDLDHNILSFSRPKTDIEQNHLLTPDTAAALQRILDCGELSSPGPLVRRIERSGKAGKRGMSTSGLNFLVGDLGRLVGVENLSPHDCRHYWATLAAASDTDPFALQEAGGWSNLETPRRYIERQKIANKNVYLDRKKAKRFEAQTELPSISTTPSPTPPEPLDEQTY